MNVDHLLKQTCTLSTAGVQDKFGKKSEGAGVAVACRFQKTSRVISTVQKDLEAIDGLIWLSAGTSVSNGDKIVFETKSYKVMKVEPIVDRNGTTRHLEVMVQEWNV